MIQFVGDLCKKLFGNPLSSGLLGVFFTYGLMEIFDLPFIILSFPVLVSSMQIQRLRTGCNSEKDHHMRQVSNLHLSMIECLAKTMDAKDKTTHRHIRRVQVYAVELGKRVGLSENELNGLRAAALLHDIGKLAIPESILNKPGKLTEQEFSIMKLHTIAGAEILSHMSFPYPVVPAVRYHHEHYDGTGYPDGLEGNKIPISARILTLADFYDALRSDRPYRRTLPHEAVIGLIEKEKGKLFDPGLADLFCKHISEFEDVLKQAPTSDAEGLQEFWKGVEQRSQAAVSSDSMTPTITYPKELAHQDVFALYKLAQNTESQLDLDDTLSVVGNKLSRLVPAESCVIYLGDPEQGYIEARYARGAHSNLFRGLRLRRDQGLTGWAVTSQRPITNADPTFDLEEILPEMKGTYASATSMPLVENNLGFGAVTLYTSDPKGLSEDHLRMLEVIAGPMGRAIAQSISTERTKHNALEDPITGLGNWQYLRITGEEKLNWARRTGSPLALLTMDLDGFSSINRDYGTHIGDQVLREIGQVIRRTLRLDDVLARTKDDCYVALLPGLSPERAATAAERIQFAVAAHGIQVPGNQSLHLSLQLGTAHLPIDGHSLADLIHRSGQSLEAVTASARMNQGHRGASAIARAAC